MKYNMVLSAIKNEIQIENYLYKINGIDPRECNYLPRISKLKSYRYFNFVKRISCFFLISWPCFLAPCYFFLCFIRSCYKKITSKSLDSNSQCILDFASVFSSNGCFSFLKSKEHIDCKKTIVLGEFSDLFKSKWSDYKFVSVYQVLKISDLLTIFRDSVVFSFKLHGDKQIKDWILQGYVIFDILLRYRALYILEKNIIISDHFDRWAVLTDFVVSEINKKKSVSFTVLQHGVLTLDFFDEMSTLPFNLETKLRNITHLIVYDELSMRVFLNQIISNDRCIIKVNPPIIKLTPIHSSKIKILFVGNSCFYNLHANIYNFLKQQHPDVDFYYRPHPTQVINLMIKNVGWMVYDKIDCIPDVDIIVAYPSTLAYEYHLAGKLVITHNMYSDINDCLHIVNSVNEMLNKRDK